MSCVVALALCSLAGESAAQATHEQEVGARIEVAAGYDSNPLLALDPNARSAEAATDGPGPGGVLNAVGDAYAVFGDAPWLGAALASDARVYHGGDVRHDSVVSLLTGTSLHDARMGLIASAGRYDASFGLDDAWYGELRPTLRWLFSPRVSLGLEAHADGRRYADGGQTNWDLGGAIDLQLRAQRWTASMGLDLDRRQSSEATAERLQVTPSLLVSVRLAALSVSLRYAAFARWFDRDGQDGLEHTAQLGARHGLGAHVSLSARVGAGFARGQDQALHYERLYVALGLAVAWGDAARPPLPTSEPLDRREQGAARLERNVTRLSVCVPGAREVSVVGTFNDWSPERGRMARTDGDCFAIEWVVPAGHHRYQWMVDGALRRPDNAPAYAPDGFGGQDAVLIVPE